MATSDAIRKWVEAMQETLETYRAIQREHPSPKADKAVEETVRFIKTLEDTEQAYLKIEADLSTVQKT